MKIIWFRLRLRAALHCPDPARPAAVYQSVINRYDARALDFDIEGDLDQASLQRRNLALISLRAANPGWR